MILGLCGPTDLYCLRRTELASHFTKRVFLFDDLTVKYARELNVLYRGHTYDQLVEANDRAGIILLRQHIEDGLRRINKRIYTDWMTNEIVTKAFPQGLKISTKVTEAIVADVKYPEQASFLKKLGTDKFNRTNRLILVAGQDLPSPLCDHESEQAYKTFGWDRELDMTERDVAKACDRLKSSVLLNRSEE